MASCSGAAVFAMPPNNDNARLDGAGVINNNQDPGDGISASPSLIHANPRGEIAHHVDRGDRR
jgi:hypothetical protein